MSRVLIVEGNEDDLASLHSLLTRGDFAVESARNGAEALQKARLSPPDVVISELLMREMDGYTLLRHWKADERLKAVPFVVYTAADAEPEDERLARELGADDFLRKSGDPQQLIARLRAVQGHASTARQRSWQVTPEDQAAQLDLYSETLIRKLEMSRRLEATNRALRQDVAERANAELLQRRMAETQMAILNALPANIALVDAEGVIVSVNEAWRRFGAANALAGANFCVGDNYLTVCDRALGDRSDEAKAAAAGIRRVLRLDAKGFALEYPCHSPSEQRWYRLMVTPLDEERPNGAVIMHVDITERRQAEEALRASEREFRTLAEAMPQIVWITRPDGWCTYYNQQWMDYTGLTLEESLGHGWITPFHPDDRERAWTAWREATATLGLYSLEVRLRAADGAYRWWRTRGVPMQDDVGTALKWFGTCTDIHDLKLAESAAFRANRGLMMLSTCNEALIRAEGEMELLRSICQIAVETGGYRMAWVGYAQHDEDQTIKPMAHAGAEEGYLSETLRSWDEDDPRGQGPPGRVIRTGEAAVFSDISSDPELRRWLGPAEQRGYRSIIFLPLRDQQHTFGCLGLYSAEVHEPGADELKLLQELADNLAFGILHVRARLVQRRLQAAVLKVAASVSATIGSAFYEQLARNMADALGAHGGFVSRLQAGEPPFASTLAAVVDGSVIGNFDYVIEGTPCEDLVASDTCVITQQVQKRFPNARWLAALGAQAFVGRRLDDSSGQPLGHLFVVFREPLDDTAFVTSTLQILAARAASELEREQTDAHVRDQAALIDKARDAIVVSNLDHQITFWSKGAERLFGWSAQEARGRSLQDLLSADATIFAQADRAVRESGEWSGEMQVQARNASVLTVNGRWTLMRDAHGKPVAILSMDSDVTDQKKLEAQFFRAQRMESIGTLAGGIAHDLNNVFGPMMMSLELLSMQFPGPASAELLSILKSSAQHGAEMVRQVLAFARGVEGRRIEVQLRHLIHEIEKIANDTFLKHIQVRTSVPRDLWTVVGDPTQIHQVLLNLAVNARDAMPDGGTIVISAENRLLDEHYAALNVEARAGPHVMIQVEDTGTGIPAANIERIFDPFFTTKEVGKGTGLGLSTSLAIVKSHGGHFRVHSEPGKGTKFQVFLPARLEPPEVTAANLAAELPRGHGELILLVDDEESVRVITKATLEQFGYRTLVAADGAEAVALYAARHAEIAVVLTDVTMPVMDGPVAIQVMRRINPAVRIIAASGLAISGDAARTIGLGAEHIIQKPYTADTLLTVLRQVLGGDEDAGARE
jgi:PAS domain S-box-containing protein